MIGDGSGELDDRVDLYLPALKGQLLDGAIGLKSVASPGFGCRSVSVSIHRHDSPGLDL
jgi:hypothetical protein